MTSCEMHLMLQDVHVKLGFVFKKTKIKIFFSCFISFHYKMMACMFIGAHLFNFFDKKILFDH
jgi:hypothetical protein